MKRIHKKRIIGCFLTMSAVIFFSSLSVNAKYPERREGAAGNAEQSSVVQKVSYDKILPEVIPVNKTELERIKSLAKKDVSAAAEEMKTYEDAVLIPVLRELLNIYYADARNPDTKSINTLKETLQNRAENVFAGYEAALEERLCMDELDYEAGKVIIAFEKYTLYTDIKEIAERMGASVDVLDGTSKTLEDYMEAEMYENRHFFASFDFGISMSGPAALAILDKIDCVKALDLNAYIPVDTAPDAAEEPESEQNEKEAGTASDATEKPRQEQNGKEAGTASDATEKPCREWNGTEMTVDLAEKQETDNFHAKQDLSQSQEKVLKTQIVVNKAKFTVKKGKRVTIKAASSDGSRLTFKSSNKKVAKVTAKGRVSGIKKGTATIRIKANGVTKKVKVTVK